MQRSVANLALDDLRRGKIMGAAATRYYILGVFDQGTQLNYNHVPSLETFSGDVQLDLYAADSNRFEKGYLFEVAVTLGDGTELKKLTAIKELFEGPPESPSASSSGIPSEEQGSYGRSKAEASVCRMEMARSLDPGRYRLTQPQVRPMPGE